MRGIVLCGQHAQGHVFVQRGSEFARAEGARGIAIDQHLDHHGPVEGLVARPAFGISGVECAQVQAVADEVRQMPWATSLAGRLAAGVVVAGNLRACL